MNALRFLAALATMIAPATAQAGFVNDYATWKQASKAVQSAYLTGALDGWLQTGQQSDHDRVKARRVGLISCFTKRNFDPALALELVDDHYKAHPVDWNFGPAAVLYYELSGMCLPEINEERQKVGLPLLRRLPQQITEDTP